MPVSGAPTTHGIPTFADTDLPDLGAGGLGSILSTLDGLVAAYKFGEIFLPVAAGSIDFQSIPATAHTLVLALYSRSDAAVAGVSLQARFNNDVSASYSHELFDVSAAAVTAVETLASTSVRIGRAPGGTAPANSFGATIAEIPNYAGVQNHKALVGRSTSREGAGAGAMLKEDSSGVWFAAGGAINRITLFPSAGNFVAGTLAELYAFT